VVNVVEAVQPEHPMPRLPVGRVQWRPYPSLVDSAEAWIYAGGSHHTVFSYGVTAQELQEFADIAGIECVVIDRDTSLVRLKQELQWNETAWYR
jgi:L-arabinose isomerase